jgi:hypothetical protein
MTDGAGRDQTVDTRSDRDARTPRAAVQRPRLLEYRHLHGGLDDGQRQHALPGDRVRAFVAEPLKHLLHHRQARHHVVEVDEPVDAQA